MYTPTKTMDGANLLGKLDLDQMQAAQYIPTPLNSTAPSTSTSTPTHDQTTREKYGSSGDSKGGIRIVKRKPVLETPAKEEPPAASILGKRSSSHESEDAGLSALKQTPTRSILKKAPVYQKTHDKKIVFADDQGLPLVYIKEIEKISSIHSNSADYRCAEKNEAAMFGEEKRQGLKNVGWGILPVKNIHLKIYPQSESAKREEKRLQDLGIMRGAIFGMCPLEDIPELNDLAAKDLLGYRPTVIPTVSVPHDQDTLSVLRQLPLPGRPRPETQQIPTNQPPPGYPVIHHQPPPTIAQYTQPPVQQNTYQQQNQYEQVFEETGSSAGTAYYVSSSASTTTTTTSSQDDSTISLPDNLKEMLNKLKAKGFMPSVSSPPQQPAQPVTSFSSALQTAQQMMQDQGQGSSYGNSNSNYYGSDPAAVDGGYTSAPPMEGYVATFATPEQKAQQQSQDSRNQEGWTQSGWKIHEPCVYFTNRPGGCNRGDQCRFIHDDEMRRQKMSELPPRNNHHHHHDNHGFRGRGRGNYRGGNFRGHHDRDFRDRSHVARPSRFDNGYMRDSYVNRNDRDKDERSHRREYDNSSAASGVASGSDVPAKRPRISRFDRKDDEEPMRGQDVDHRLPRKSRFEDSRPRNSRFDQPADRDDRAAQTAFAMGTQA